MNKIFVIVTIISLTVNYSFAQLNSYPESYRIDQKDIEKARQIISAPVPSNFDIPNRHPDAQWFPMASLGLFMHWGIHSVAGAQPSWDMIANYHAFEKFLAYTFQQLEELLTGYGKIDVLWFDGMGFRGISDMYTKQVYAWIRSLQPGIVINDRWSGVVNPDAKELVSQNFGDFAVTFECRKPTYIPDSWWEHCDIWTSGDCGWGYEKNGNFLPYSWFFEHLVACRSMGGDFLPNVGPSGDGEMHPNYYKNMKAIAEWMRHSSESVIGNGPTPGAERSNLMITTRKKNWYLHLLPDFKGMVSVKTDKKPKYVVLLRTGQSVSYTYRNGFLNFKLANDLRTDMNDVVKVGL